MNFENRVTHFVIINENMKPNKIKSKPNIVQVAQHN